jgi:hypothetical protein
VDGQSIVPLLFATEDVNGQNFNGDFGSFIPGVQTDALSLTTARISAVPLPAAVWLLLSGLGALGGAARARETSLRP